MPFPGNRSVSLGPREGGACEARRQEPTVCRRLSASERVSVVSLLLHLHYWPFTKFGATSFNESEFACKVEPPIFVHLREWGSCNEL